MDLESWEKTEDGMYVIPYFRNIKACAAAIIAYARLSGKSFWVCKRALLPTGLFSKRRYIFIDFVTPGCAVEDLALEIRLGHRSMRWNVGR